MSPKIVETKGGITLLAGGPAAIRDVRMALARAPLLVAVDGGADRALGLGLMPEMAVGDFDSISAAGREKLGESRLRHVAEQETTDLDKALRSVKAGFVIGLGALGGRLDHAMAGLSVLVQRTDQAVVLLGGEDVVFAAPGGQNLQLEMQPGDRLSLYPLAAVKGESEGLEWPIGGLVLDPMGRIGTSNRCVARQVHLQFDRAGMLVILPRRRLDAALRALRR